MSLVSDFANYYVNTYVALREGDINYPLMILSVDQNGQFSRNDYSHEAEQAMFFVAQKWFKRDDGTFSHETINVPVFDPRIIHESPDVGYLAHGRDLVSWTHINPVRQRVKGLMGNKIRSLSQPRGQGISGQMVYNLFNPSFDGLVNRYVFINPLTGETYYKGALAGKVDMQAALVRGRRPLNLLDKFKHIATDFDSTHTVTLVESL